MKIKFKDIKENNKNEYVLTSELINENKKELEQLYYEKATINQNKIQNDIINNKKKLIENYKNHSKNLKNNLYEIEKKLNDKETLIRDLQNKNEQLEAKIVELNSSKIDDLNNKIIFFQEENIRLSSEISFMKNKYETIKENFTMELFEKNNIYKQIQELNDSLIKDNILETPYQKQIINEDPLNVPKPNEIVENDLDADNKETKLKKDLNDEIDNIFS